MTRGLYLRKFALFVSTSSVLLITFARAQQIDIAAGASTLLSPSTVSDAIKFQQPAEKSGAYINLSGDFVRPKSRLGLQIEASWRNRRAIYPYNGETYRPFLSALNILYQPHVATKIGLDLMGGVGIASTRFYGLDANSCSNPIIGCVNYTGSNHFMEDLGAGIRYYFWHNIFFRPEIHYYHIQNNVEFNSNNVFRVGASIGHTFGSK
jgi:hypothetical protein